MHSLSTTLLFPTKLNWTNPLNANLSFKKIFQRAYDEVISSIPSPRRFFERARKQDSVFKLALY
jgi:hypothetical protein